MRVYRDYNNLSGSLKFGCLCTVAMQTLSLLLGGYVFSEWRLCALGLPLGWLPILTVALRRPERPSQTDVTVIFGGFPVIFATLAVLDHWYFHVP
jgi:hypothetical protein